jgi:hypothetical protein
MKLLSTILFSLVFVAITNAQQLTATLEEESIIADNALFFDGTKHSDTNPDGNYRFANRISPHGDCIDVVGGFVFVTWYKGGFDNRHLMLSRKNLDDPNADWVTIEFPHQHIGWQGNPNIGDSHNTAAIGICTIDETIHILYDMHAYTENAYPDDFFNYSVSIPNAAFVPDAEFNLSLFNPKQDFLKAGQNYDRVTYPGLHRADDGSLVTRYRRGGSGNGDIWMASYNGSSWSNNWLYSDGSIPLPDRYSLYGQEKFLHGTFYSIFSIRYAQNDNYTNNNGLYFASTDAIPVTQSNQWKDVNGGSVSMPIGVADAVKIAEPSDDYGTTDAPRTSFDPAFTVTESGAIHAVTRVDNANVHYYRGVGETAFSSNSGGAIPFPQVRGDIFSHNNYVFMVELLGGKPVIKATPEGENNWEIIYSAITEPTSFRHFDAVLEEDKLYVYLMENTPGDACPLHLQVFNLSEGIINYPTFATIDIEAEDYDEGGQDVAYNDTSPGNSGGVYRTDDVDIEAKSTASNGHSITQFAGNEWMRYTFQVDSAGVYDFNLIAANRNQDSSIVDVEINGVLYEDFIVTRTFDWDVFLPSSIPDIMLNEGENVVKITQKMSLSSRPDKLEFISNIQLVSTRETFSQETTIYPNPSDGIFNVKTTVQNLRYAVMSLEGKILQQGELNQNKINLSNYPKGLYFLQLSSDNRTAVKKLVLD